MIEREQKAVFKYKSDLTCKVDSIYILCIFFLCSEFLLTVKLKINVLTLLCPCQYYAIHLNISLKLTVFLKRDTNWKNSLKTKPQDEAQKGKETNYTKKKVKEILKTDFRGSNIKKELQKMTMLGTKQK